MQFAEYNGDAALQFPGECGKIAQNRPCFDKITANIANSAVIC